MQPEQFNQLSNCEKYYLIEQSGICFDLAYTYNGYQVALFGLGSLYVAVWLHIRTDKLKKAVVVPFDKLDPFLACIDLTSIISAIY